MEKEATKSEIMPVLSEQANAILGSYVSARELTDELLLVASERYDAIEVLTRVEEEIVLLVEVKLELTSEDEDVSTSKLENDDEDDSQTAAKVESKEVVVKPTSLSLGPFSITRSTTFVDIYTWLKV